NADPVNTTFYSANSSFGNGSQIGSGNYVVFRSITGSSVTITNLVPNTAYHFAVYDYNGVVTPAFLTPGATGNTTTAPQPTVPATSLNFTGVDGGSLRANWTVGNGQRRIVIARPSNPVTALPVNGVDYNASAAFGSGDAVLP